MVKRFATFLVLSGFFVMMSAPLSGAEHSLVFSTSGAASAPELPEIQDEELLLFTPGLMEEPGLFFAVQSWMIVTGDGNGNGRYDEIPSDIDGLHLMDQGLARPNIFNFAFSFDTGLTFPSGDDVEDGDIFMILPGGVLGIIFSEEDISAATGTSTIDIDGFTLNSAGDSIFSFDKDEETSHAGLIAENNGETTIREGTILKIERASMIPHVLYREEDVLAMVNRAMGSKLTSIVDTQGLESDPLHQGEFLFIIGSSTSLVEGTVFSTFNGGTVAEMNGKYLSGSSFGFSTEEVLSAITVISVMNKPLRLGTDKEVSIGGANFLQIKVFDGTPNGKVQLVGSPALFPITTPTQFCPPLNGTRNIFVDFSSPQFWMTATAPYYSLQLDGEGKGTFSFPTHYLVPERTYLIQAIDYKTFEASDGIAFATVQ